MSLSQHGSAPDLVESRGVSRYRVLLRVVVSQTLWTLLELLEQCIACTDSGPGGCFHALQVFIGPRNSGRQTEIPCSSHSLACVGCSNLRLRCSRIARRMADVPVTRR
jgi:hypothetical protein